MRVLFSTGTLWGLPFPLTFQLVRAAGFDGVELVLDPISVALGPRAVRWVSKQMNLPVPVVHPSLFALPGWKKQPQTFRRLGQYASELGTDLIVLHPPRYKDLERNVADFDRGLAAMRKIVGEKVRIGLENSAVFHPKDWEHPYVWPENVAQFAAERGLELVIDTTHVVSTGLLLDEALAPLIESIAHLHLSDFRLPLPLLDRPSLDTYFKHHQMPGLGNAPLRSFLRNLRESGYAGDITIEVSPFAMRFWNPPESVRILRQAVVFAKSAWWDADEQRAPATKTLSIDTVRSK